VSRSAAYAMWDDDRDRCPDCGRPTEICADATRDWFPQKTVCWASAARSVAIRRWQARTENASPDAAGYLPDDGVTISVSQIDLTPDEDFLTPSIFQPFLQPEGGD